MLLGSRDAEKSSGVSTILRRSEQPKIFTHRRLFFYFERMVCRRNITMADTEIDQRWKCVVMDTEWIPFKSKLWQRQDKAKTEEKVVSRNGMSKIKSGTINIKGQSRLDGFEQRDRGGGRIHFIQGLLGDLQPEIVGASLKKIQTLQCRPRLGE